MTRVRVNGESRTLPDEATVAAALDVLGTPADGRGVAVAIDGEIVPRGQWAATALLEGQEIEIVQAVQGG
jgi:sulfur carrier protein